MSSDPVVSEVASATENSSTKRSLDSECKKNDALPEKTSSLDSTASNDVENPPKRLKVEAPGEEETAAAAVVVKNPLNRVDTNGTPPSQPTNDIKKGNGDAGAKNHGSESLAPADTDTMDTGIEDNDDDDESKRGKSSASLSAPSPALTRSRASSSSSTEKKKDEQAVESIKEEQVGDSEANEKPKARWRVHQMAEDYTNLVGSMMYPATQFQSYGYNPQERQYPIEKISLLGFIKSPLRRPTVIEKWSPYEIAIFEGSMLHYGKEFRSVSKQIGTKTTQEVIDFYYVWKKTAHYKRWKEQYISDEDLIDEVYVPLKKPKR